MKTLIAAGKYPKHFSQHQISNAFNLKIRDAVAASLSFTGSAISGSIKGLAVGIYEQTAE